MHHVKSKL